MARFNIAAWNRRHRKGRKRKTTVTRRRTRRSHSRRRRFSRGRRGVAGKSQGILGRVVHTITQRPLKVVSIGLGVAAAGEVILGSSSTGDGINFAGHLGQVVTNVMAQRPIDASNNAQAAIRDIGAGAMSGTWILPAAGAIITGIISRKFRI